MAENRRFFPFHQQLDLQQILREAQNRWLRPTEICEVLRNHQKFQLTPSPPVRPSAGSLFLFDRKALRYFRKDGHRWRKKKDGKTVKEAHEKLKAGSVDVLHCYYAHGEDNENFQRRSYWMLDESLEHIVLVHYREVKEGYKSGISRLHHADPGPKIESHQASSAAFLTHRNLLDATSQAQSSFVSSPKTFSWAGNLHNAELGDGEDSGLVSRGQFKHDREASLLTDFGASSVIGYPDSTRADFYRGTDQSSGSAIHNSLSEAHTVNDKILYNEQSSGADLMGHKLTSQFDIGLQDLTFGDGLIPSIDINALKHDSHRPFQMLEGHESRPAQTQFQHISDSSMIITPAHQAKSVSNEIAKNDASVELKKLDSFGRWMDKEIGGDCDDSLMASDSGNYWNTIDAQNGEKEVSSLSRHMQLDGDSLGPSLSQEQLFSVDDFSPDWAYCGVETKVLVVGKFLGDKTHSTGAKWSCMFGEIEVSAEVLGETVIRCYAPVHSPGPVPFYITCSNRLSCSEVREFQYIEKPLNPGERKGAPEDEVRFQLRLAKMLCSAAQTNWTDCSIEGCDKCKLKKQIHSMINDSKNKFGRTKEAVSYLEDDSNHLTDVVIEELLKYRLPEWLVSKVHEGGKGPHVLDEKGLGVIHLAAGLGYEWAMSSIVAARVSPNFRDARGRTSLHWASFYGREETVSELIRLGAAPGAVDDPTSEFPGGQTAADLASCRGYKGIAAYLAEADLTEHLSLLSVNGNALDSVAATIAADKAIENAAEVVALSNGASDEQKSLRGSLAAVRKSAQTAALIHAAFRARSFRHRQFIESKTDGPEALADLVAQGSLNKVQKMSHFEDYLHCAALKIQQKYRGWKGRKDFLQIRSRIVKIQAHVRGHQVRKQYKRVVWSVSIVEKVILRWRRGGSGLRGFRVGKDVNAVLESEKTDEYDFLRIGRKQKFAGVERALARVKSMVRQPDARDQYMRMVSKFQNFKMNNEESSS